MPDQSVSPLSLEEINTIVTELSDPDYYLVTPLVAITITPKATHLDFVQRTSILKKLAGALRSRGFHVTLAIPDDTKEEPLILLDGRDNIGA